MILLRHGQSEFNLLFTQTKRDPGIVDPKLTPLGHEQAEAAAVALASAGLRRIIASPYTRALQTAEPIARRLGIKVHVNPIVGERYAFACDIGTPRTALARDWPQHDFSAIEEVWWPAMEEPVARLAGRASRFRAEMAAIPDWSDTLVVSHWGFILAMTGTKVTNGQQLRCDPTAPAPDGFTWHH